MPGAMREEVLHQTKIGPRRAQYLVKGFRFCRESHYLKYLFGTFQTEMRHFIQQVLSKFPSISAENPTKSFFGTETGR